MNSNDKKLAEQKLIFLKVLPNTYSFICMYIKLTNNLYRYSNFKFTSILLNSVRYSRESLCSQ